MSLLVLLAACRGDLTDGLSERAARAVQECGSLAGERRDWCALEGLRATPGLPGADVVAVCRRLARGTSADHCWELSVRAPGPAGVEACDRIGDAHLATSCYLEVATLTAEEGRFASIEDAIAMCRRSGSLARHCAFHVATGWRGTWSRQGAAQFDADVGRLVAELDGAGTLPAFGDLTGKVARTLGPDAGVVCARMLNEETEGSCTEAFLGRGKNPSADLSRGGSPGPGAHAKPWE